MKTKTIIILIKIINECMVKMFNGNEDAIEKYNRASWVLDDVILKTIKRGENPHTIEIDKLITIEREIFHNSHKKVLWAIEETNYY